MILSVCNAILQKGKQMGRLKRCTLVGLWGIIFLLGGITLVYADPVTDKLKKDFPDFVFGSVIESPIKGIYAVIYAEKEIVYYMPKAGILLTGEMIARGGTNLTEDIRSDILSRRFKDISIEKGIKIGEGKHTVVEFTDPDCSHCRHGALYFSDRTDVTQYIFFWPITQDSRQKVRQILCADDSAKVYEETMAGVYDGREDLSICTNSEVDNLMAEHRALAERLGLTGVPVYFINGKAVYGANIPMINSLLKGEQETTSTEGTKKKK